MTIKPSYKLFCVAQPSLFCQWHWHHLPSERVWCASHYGVAALWLWTAVYQGSWAHTYIKSWQESCCFLQTPWKLYSCIYHKLINHRIQPLFSGNWTLSGWAPSCSISWSFPHPGGPRVPDIRWSACCVSPCVRSPKRRTWRSPWRHVRPGGWASFLGFWEGFFDGQTDEENMTH